MPLLTSTKNKIDTNTNHPDNCPKIAQEIIMDIALEIALEILMYISNISIYTDYAYVNVLKIQLFTFYLHISYRGIFPLTFLDQPQVF